MLHTCIHTNIMRLEFNKDYYTADDSGPFRKMTKTNKLNDLNLQLVDKFCSDPSRLTVSLTLHFRYVGYGNSECVKTTNKQGRNSFKATVCNIERNLFTGSVHRNIFAHISNQRGRDEYASSFLVVLTSCTFIWSDNQDHRERERDGASKILISTKLPKSIRKPPVDAAQQLPRAAEVNL